MKEISPRRTCIGGRGERLLNWKITKKLAAADVCSRRRSSWEPFDVVSFPSPHCNSRSAMSDSKHNFNVLQQCQADVLLAFAKYDSGNFV
jgi:hypothetical protein